jgi:hypothetical protein
MGFIARLSSPLSNFQQPWIGFRTLLVEEDIPEPVVLARLASVGIEDVLSESTEPVLISNWAGLEAMSLTEARIRLLPSDPRLDDYLTRLAVWFQASSGRAAYRVYYVKEASFLLSGASLERGVARGLSDFQGKFLLPDSSLRASSCADGAIAFLCAIALLLLASVIGPLSGIWARGRPLAFFHAPKARTLDRAALRVIMILPWIVLSSGGIDAAAIAVVWGIAIAEAADALDLPLEEFRSVGGPKSAMRSLRLMGRPALALPAMAIFASIILPERLPSIGLAALGSAVAVIGYGMAFHGPSGRQRFTPLPILGLRRSRAFAFSFPGRMRAALACLVALAWGLYSLPYRFDRPIDTGITRPLPDHSRESSSLSISEARRLAPSEIGEILPCLASYLVHKAMQEALPYEKMGEIRSDPFASASLPVSPSAATTGKDGGGIEFSDGWARASLASLSPLSIEGMLLRQGPSTVGRIEGGASSKGEPLAPIDSLLYIFLLVPPVGRMLLSPPKARRAAPGELRQEA